MNLDQALQTFFAESRELLQQMESLLLQLEETPQDEEAINALFRVAHTIKGSAGLFGLEHIVNFTHIVENLLDGVRVGEVAVTPALIAELLLCCDHIDDLIEHAAADSDPDGTKLAAGHELVSRLKEYTAPPLETAHPIASGQITPHAETWSRLESSGGGAVGSDSWHVSLRFGHDVLRNGLDPLSFIRYLKTLGDITSIYTLVDALPDAATMDSESCYLGFEINLDSDAEKQTIEEVFEFVRHDCQIHILAPRSRIGDYIELIQKLPEEDAYLGEILIKSGALTRKELEEGLALQRSVASPLGEILIEQRSVHEPVVTAALEKQKQHKENKANEARSIRVQADRLDALINLVGELVIAAASVNLLAQHSKDGALQEAASTVSGLVEEIRDSALNLRMVEIGETFSRFQRVVRDVAMDLGKEIALKINGADTELDKTVVEKISDPLMHLVRNALDHGIEPSEVRLGRGKPAQGSLCLTAYHDSGSVVIEVADDGGGLNRDRILAKAVERGLVSDDQGMSNRDVYNLIFEPGFSTAEKITDLSGRGVGMDVVKRNIEALRGTVEIDSSEGVGTTVRIRLPLTLAIIDGFLVGVGNTALVVPLDMVLECVDLPEQANRDNGDCNYLNLRGEVLPYVRLREQFDIEGQAGRRENVVVVQYGGRKAGLVVDELLGEYQTVIKPLGKVFSRTLGLGGFTILGTGAVALILDIRTLIQEASRQDVAKAGAASS